MIDSRRIRLDRIASAVRHAGVSREVIIGPEIVCEEGHVLAVRILNDKRVYNQVESSDGRLVPLRRGDVLAGVLGARRALRGYAGDVPGSLRVGDTINVLNLGGVLGRCTASNPDLGPPFEAEVLGAVLSFPKLGDRVGRPAHIRDRAIPPAPSLECSTPLVLVAGTCMSSGKTVAASEIIRGLARDGRTVGGAKLTGVSLRRDALSMVDSGAAVGLSFNDAGVVSTHEAEVLPAAYALLNELEARCAPRVIVAELGDGILGEYGVQALLADPAIRALLRCLVVCAPDQVGAWGATAILRSDYGLRPTVISGPVTDNAVGKSYIAGELGIPAWNARREPERLVTAVLEVLDA
ncbi:MAG: hypothetical protein GXP47_04720 [Acidobacteria bacterium]|nr:hypothetical protein [Acidobacteriota bacterium]